MARQTLFAFGCVLLLAFASSVRADDDNVHDPDTIVLTNDNFNSYVDNEDLILVEFYAPWCGHCKRLAPEYAKAATTLKSNDPPVKLAKLDATAHSEAAGKFGISGYPTLKVFRNGQPSDYKGPRDADGIVAYMKKQVGPAAKLVETEKDLERYLSTPDVNFWVLGLFGQGTTKSALHSAFLLTANKLREDHVFLKTTNPDILKKYDVSTEAVLALKLFDDRQTKFTKTGTKALEEFIAQNSIPLVGEFNATTAELYQRQDKPILKLFVKVDWASNFRHTQYYINRLKDVATTHRADLLVALADIDKQSQEMESLNLKDKVAPLVIDDRGVKYVSTEKFSAENVKKFVESFQSGDAEKYVKSEDVPKDNKGPVKTVVGKTFEDIVLDDEKDVMIEFYAPWCGHCKSLEPKYKELGQKFKKDKNVVIAKIDATANDFPRDTFEVSGYPTIFFKPAGQSPKKYDGDREVSAMSAFIKKHAKAGKKSKKKN